MRNEIGDEIYHDFVEKATSAGPRIHRLCDGVM